jgi:hypothetical protein
VPVGVGDQHDVHRVVGDGAQRAAQHRQAGAERVRRAQVGQLVGGEDDRRRPVVGVDVRGQAAPPRLRDHRAGCLPARAVAQHRVEDLGQPAGVRPRVAGDLGRRGAAVPCPLC